MKLTSSGKSQRCPGRAILALTPEADCLVICKEGGSPQSQSTLGTCPIRISLDGSAGNAIRGRIGLAFTEHAMATNPLSEGVILKDTYRVLRRLGGGGMGEVYEAEHTRLAGRYAIKRLLPEAGQDPAAFRRFRREAEIASSLQHPNIVQVIDFDVLQDGSPYLVMELLQGHDLDETLQRVGKLLPQRAADIVEQTAAGLSAAHGKGIVHRDLKPANIFVVPLPGTQRELVKLVDFGISKILAAKTKLTADASVIGTPQYMSPEQASGSTVGPETDQFALALIAREMLTGMPAFDGDSVAVLIYKVVHQQPPSLAELGFQTHPDVEAVLNRAMNKRPSERFASITDFSRAFRQAIDAWLLGATVAVDSIPSCIANAATVPVAVSQQAPVSFPQPISSGSSAVQVSGASANPATEPNNGRVAKRRLGPVLAILFVVAALVAVVSSWWHRQSSSVSTATAASPGVSIATPVATTVSAAPALVASAAVVPVPAASEAPLASGPVVAHVAPTPKRAAPSATYARKSPPREVELDVAPPNPYLKKESK